MDYEPMQMKVVVGLGNPGKKYANTRHNVGFDVIDRLTTSGFQDRFEAEIGEMIEEGTKVLLVKPQTFMNLSGRVVRQVLDFYKVPFPSDRLLVVCDDMALPLGKLRFRARGTHGGHNGLRDIQSHLGTTEYSRLRIGVDAPNAEGGAIDHVLGKFRPAERPLMADAIILAMQSVVAWIRNGIDVCMNRYNG